MARSQMPDVSRKAHLVNQLYVTQMTQLLTCNEPSVDLRDMRAATRCAIVFERCLSTE